MNARRATWRFSNRRLRIVRTTGPRHQYLVVECRKHHGFEILVGSRHRVTCHRCGAHAELLRVAAR